MAKKHYRSKDETAVSRSVKQIGFRPTPDVDAEIRKLADEMNVPVAKVCDDLVRSGLITRGVLEQRDEDADRLEKALRQLDAKLNPHGDVVRAEHLLVGTALAGQPAALRLTKVLDASVFTEPIMRSTWQLIANETVLPFSTRRQAMNRMAMLENILSSKHPNADVRTVVEGLVDHSVALITPTQLVEEAAATVMNCYIRRSIDEAAGLPSLSEAKKRFEEED